MIDKNNKKEIIYFATILFAIFLVSAITFSIFGLAPDGLKASDIIDSNGAREGSIGFQLNKELDYDTAPDSTSGIETYTRPDRIVIDSIGVNSIIGQPNTRNVADLDSYLLKGAVHYPGSGSIEYGNMFLFGHSAGFQIVQNQAYKTFNDLDKLNKNDEIKIFADGQEYIYKVRKVSLVNEADARVDFDNSKRTLTISTCNSFGEIQDRWVVEADFYREV